MTSECRLPISYVELWTVCIAQTFSLLLMQLGVFIMVRNLFFDWRPGNGCAIISKNRQYVTNNLLKKQAAIYNLP